MDTLPFDVIPIIFHYIKSIIDKRQFMKTCVAYHKMTKNFVDVLNKNLIGKHFVYYVKNYYNPYGFSSRTLFRLPKPSNIFYCHVCNKCGSIISKLSVYRVLRVRWCITCNGQYNIISVQIPQIFKPIAEILSKNWNI